MSTYGAPDGPLRSFPVRLIPIILALIAAGVYLVTHLQTGPFGRRQVVGLSPAEENQLGAQAYRQILGKSDVVEGGPAVDVVRRVGRLLAGASNAPEVLERLRLKPRDFAWEFRLVRDRQVNAFCLPGGKVV